MQFADNKFRHDDAMSLSFRTLSSCKADKVAELVEEVCHDHFDLNFTNMLSSSVQDTSACAVSK